MKSSTPRVQTDLGVPKKVGGDLNALFAGLPGSGKAQAAFAEMFGAPGSQAARQPARQQSGAPDRA